MQVWCVCVCRREGGCRVWVPRIRLGSLKSQAGLSCLARVWTLSRGHGTPVAAFWFVLTLEAGALSSGLELSPVGAAGNFFSFCVTANSVVPTSLA